MSGMRAPFLSLNEAMQIAASVDPLPPERIALARCGGRVLAEPIDPQWELPRDALSVMDGYAVAVPDAQRTAETPVRWTVVGQSLAGHALARSLGPGECMRVTTGSVVPDGTFCVLPQEAVERHDDELQLHAAMLGELRSGRYVRPRGTEVPGNQVLFAAGTAIAGPELALAAAAGHVDLLVHAMPRVGLISTGDELRPPGSALVRGEIIATHELMLAEALAAGRHALNQASILKDDPELLRTSVEQALQSSLDVLLIAGGMSVGAADHTRAVLEAMGASCRIGSIQARPGRLALMATLPRTGPKARDLIVFGLPGNPGSAYLATMLLVLPCLQGLRGVPMSLRVLPQVVIRVAADQLPRHGGGALEELVRARVEPDGTIVPLRAQSSGALRSICGFHLLLRLRASSPVSDGNDATAVDAASGEWVELKSLVLEPSVLPTLKSWQSALRA